MEIVLLVLLGVAVIFDIICYKIPNALTIATLVVGLAYKGIRTGLPGLCKALTAFIIVLIIMMILYALKAIGAGDAKIISALAVYYDVWQTINISLLALFIGGFLGLIILIRSFIYNRRLHRTNYSYSVWIIDSLRSRHHFHFSIAIILAVILHMLGLRIVVC